MIYAVEAKGNTYPKKEKLKANSFRWTFAIPNHVKTWVKQVKDGNEACEVVKQLEKMGLGWSVGMIENNTYYAFENVGIKEWYPEIYTYMNSKNQD